MGRNTKVPSVTETLNKSDSLVQFLRYGAEFRIIQVLGVLEPEETVCCVEHGIKNEDSSVTILHYIELTDEQWKRMADNGLTRPKDQNNGRKS